MKNLLLALIFGAAFWVAAGQYSETAVPRFQKVEVTIDGVPNEKIWEKALKITDFKIWRTQDKADVDTTVMMCFDNENLYFGLICMEPNVITESENSVWTSDYVEVFFGNLGETQWYRQIVFSTQMKRYNEFIENDQYQLATKVSKNQWSAEMIVPLKYLGKMPNDTFRFNMMRCRRKPKVWRRTIAPIKWAHDVNRFLNMRIYTPADEVTHGPWTFGLTTDFVGVNWETAGPIAANLYIRKQGEASFRKIPADIYASAQQNNRKLHTAYVKNLTPGTAYEYHVGDGNIRTVRTLATQSGDFTFAMTSDIHCHNAELLRVLRNQEVRKAEFLLLNGDISTAFIGRQMCYDGYLDTIIANWNKPFYMIRGNHESRGGAITDYFELFAPHTGKSYFSMFHKGVFFIVLDTDADAKETDSTYLDEQFDWLKKVVASPEFAAAELRVLISHVPFYRSKEVTNLMNSMPPAALAAVDLVLNGHCHNYSKILPGSDKIVTEDTRFKGKSHKFDIKVPCPILVNDQAGAIVVKKDQKKLSVLVLNNAGKTLDTLEVNKR